jgi:mannose-6-phosphate isomerase-like protein (cupin superfamily)
MADAFQVRRVVVGRGENGTPTIASDATPPLTIDAPTGFGVSELLWSSGPLTTTEAGGVPPRDAVGAFPENGGVAARLIRFPATNEWVRIAGDDPERPGMHRSETLDLMVVLSGRIVIGVEDGEVEVGPGDAVVQRGTLHRWRVTGEDPCTYLSVLLAPADGPPAPSPSPGLPQLQVAGSPRLLVTGQGTHGSTISVAGTSAPDQHGRRRWWDTGGALRSVDQGGLFVGGDDHDQPAGGAVALTMIDLAIAGSAGFCTAVGSIELILVLSGTPTLDATAGASPSDGVGQFDKLSLSAGDVLLTRDVALRLTSTSGALAVVTFTPASA